MKIIRGSRLEYIPASHENPKSPGSLKKVLIKKEDLQAGTVQMINWSLLPSGKSFQAHYHEDMEELFIIIKGTVELKVGEESAVLGKGDCVRIPSRSIHSMKNNSGQDAEYIAVGIASGTGGKTVVVAG